MSENIFNLRKFEIGVSWIYKGRDDIIFRIRFPILSGPVDLSGFKWLIVSFNCFYFSDIFITVDPPRVPVGIGVSLWPNTDMK